MTIKKEYLIPLLWFVIVVWGLPNIGKVIPIVNPNIQVTSVTWVYEKDEDGEPPSYVETGLDKINKSMPGVVATLCEDDADVGIGQIPLQYKIQVEEGRKTAGPDLVVMAGNTLVRSLKGSDVKTEDDVIKSAN